jgi:hypothetical protein
MFVDLIFCQENQYKNKAGQYFYGGAGHERLHIIILIFFLYDKDGGKHQKGKARKEKKDQPEISHQPIGVAIVLRRYRYYGKQQNETR